MAYGFILPRLILEQFGSEVNGLIQSIGQFLGIIGFLDMGVSQVVRSALYRPLEEHNYAQISCVMVSGLRFYRKIACCLIGYVVLLIVFYPILVNQSFDWIFTASLIAILSISSFAQYYFGVTQEQLLHASQKSYLIYVIQIVFYLFNTVICVCMIRMNCSIHAIKVATACIFLIKPLFYTWYIRRRYTIDWHIQYDEEPLTQKWHGIAQHISAVVLEGTDSIVLTLFSTLSNVSIYSVYHMIVGSIQGFYQAISVGFQSAAGAAWAKRDQANIKRLFSTVEACLHAITVFLFCCAGVLVVPFVQVYTNGLTDANYYHPLFAITLVLAYGIRCLRTPYNIWILAAGHFKQVQKCHIIAAILNLVVSILAVSHWGLIGVAIGTLIAMCYQTVWMLIYTTKKLVKCTSKHIFRQLFADFTAALLVCVTTAGINLQGFNYLGWLVMAVKVSLIAGLCIAAVFCLFFPKEVQQLAKRFAVKTGRK